MDKALAVLSGTSANVEILHKTMSEYGENPKKWLGPFLNKVAKEK